MKQTDFIYGIRPVIEAIRAGKVADKILMQQNLRSELLPELRQLAREHGVPIQTVPSEKLNRMTNGNHQGVICYLSEVAYGNIEALLPGIYESGQNPLIVVADRITDVRNLGAIARTAECAGAHAMLLPLHNTARINADAVKTSSGALHKLPVCRTPDMAKSVVFLQKSGLQVLACSEKAADSYYDVDFSLPTAVIFGSEEDGISTDLIRIADRLVRIPMAGTTASLNVSVAAGIILFEVVKQRLQMK